MNDCPLCREEGGLLIYRNALLRIVRVTDTPAHPVFYRVIVNAHVAEFSQLTKAERVLVMEAVALVEAVLIDQLQPAKVNLASLGNMVPHVHWHVVARFDDDAQFPAPIWAAPVRAEPAERNQVRKAHLPQVDAKLQAVLEAALVV